MSSNSNSNLFDASANSIVYETVTRSFGETFENGGEEYKYLTIPGADINHGTIIYTANRRGSISEPELLDRVPRINYYDYFGKLVQKKVLGQDGQTVLKNEEYEYNGKYLYSQPSSVDLRNGKDINAYSIIKCFNYNFNYSTMPPTLSHYCTLEDTQNSTHPCYQQSVGSYVQVESINEYDVIQYKILSRWAYLKKKIVTQYDQNGNNPVVAETNYFYDNEDHAQLSRDSISNSDGRVRETKYYYPHDYDINAENFSTIINDKHIIDKPIDVRTYNNTQLTSGTQTKFNNDGQPIDVYNAEVSAGADIAFSPTTPFTFTHKATYEYNTDKAIKQVSPVDNLNTTYLWDATGTYVMAKIENATYSQISTHDGKLCTYSSQNLFAEISSSVSGALITTFTHKPLVGVTQQTNPTGVTTYYEYDDFGRLSIVNPTCKWHPLNTCNTSG